MDIQPTGVEGELALNEDLLETALSIKEERTLLRERLEKLEQTKASVSPSVYMRVHADYAARLEQTTQKLLSLKRDLDKEERSLSGKRSDVEKQITLHRESVEENQLRHTLGELAEERMAAENRSHTEEISRLEESLSLLNTEIDRRHRIFEGDLTPPKASPPPPAPPPAIKRVGKELPPRPAPAPDLSSENTSRVEVRMETETVAQPSPEKASAPELNVIENGHTVQRLSVTKTVGIGRSPSCQVVLKDAKVSRRHAEIQIINGRYILVDLESSNGTLVNGEKIKEHVLNPGDEIAIGTARIVFQV